MQTAVTIHVFQGERPMAADNTSLGEFNLGGLPPAPRGVPKIEVTFDIDASGILDVSAKDTATGRSQSIRISGSTRLPEAEKQRMMKEAERYAEEDRRRKEDAERLNDADSTAYHAERMLAELAEKLGDETKRRLETGMREVREAVSKRDARLAAERAEALKKDLRDAGAALYAQASSTAQAGATVPPPSTGPAEARPTGGPRGKVVDAEYQEKKSG
jgi:molecular chaperone DnaK